MIKRLALAICLTLASLAGTQVLASVPAGLAVAANQATGSPAPERATPSHAAPSSRSVAIGGPQGVIELKYALTPFKQPDSGPSAWYIFTAVNDSKQPTTRVLRAGQPPGIGLSFFPKGTRPTVLQVVSTAPGVLIERSNAYGRHGFRVTVPASSLAPLAVRITAGQAPPSLLAWTEPALAAHNRQLAIFIAAIAGLIGAAAAIAAGLAVMTHHRPPRWAAVTLLLMLLARLSAIGLFDGSLVTSVGGPYGLTALFAGLALASGIQFIEAVAPVERFWPQAKRWVSWSQMVLIALAIMAYLGVPGATLITNVAIVAGTVGILGYLVFRGRRGSQPARVLTPSAALFVMLALGATFTAAGGFGTTSVVPDLAGGFAAAGAVMLALAVAAGEGVAVPFVRHVTVGPAQPPHRPAESTSHPALEAIGASHQGVFELDFASDTITLSREAAALFGFETTRLPHAEWRSRIHGDDIGVYDHAMASFAKQSGQAFRIEFRLRTVGDRHAWCELRATMKGPDGGRAERCVGLLADVTVRKETDAEMMDRALRDPLTGLGNRVALMEELEKLGDRLREMTFAVLDIDRFKTIHASLGDRGGDDVLSKVAERLTRQFQGLGQVFRIGGDAFAVLLRRANPVELGAGLVETCGAAHHVEDRNVFAPASVGVALGGEARDPIDLLKNAGLALRRAKQQGGDCARIYSPEMENQTQTDAVVLESELRRALEQSEIDVFYQPIVRLADRTVAGFEALLRWRHPSRGLVAPSDFIAHSEETGLIVSLGHFALSRAAKDLEQWQRYFPLSDPLFISVNLSRRQMQDPAFADNLAELLRGAGLAPGTLKLEITESAIATDADVRALMARIRELGAGLAIDDFGTGMSSLSQLADLPFDAVKIDRSFLARHGGTDLESDGDVVLASIVSLAHDLKRAVIVEGVETEADARRVAEMGCEYAQGFLFSEPIPMQDALAYIARRFRTGEEAPPSSGAAGLSG